MIKDSTEASTDAVLPAHGHQQTGHTVDVEKTQVKRREICDTRTERETAANRCCRSMTVLNTNIFEVGTTPVRPKPDEN